MLETLMTAIVAVLIFGGGATWGAWFTTRLKDKETVIPFAPVERGGVAYDDEETEAEEAQDDSHKGYATL